MHVISFYRNISGEREVLGFVTRIGHEPFLGSIVKAYTSPTLVPTSMTEWVGDHVRAVMLHVRRKEKLITLLYIYIAGKKNHDTFTQLGG